MTSRRGSWRKNRDIANAGLREALAVVEAAKAEKAAEIKARANAARQVEAERVRFTAEDLAGAVVVRDRFGWHKVVRVSAKSVTVETPYSWTDRIAIDKVLEFRKAES